jgi:hypothetical protein
MAAAVTGEAWSRELGETDLERGPNNVGNVEFTDSGERALKGRSLHRTWGGSQPRWLSLPTQPNPFQYLPPVCSVLTSQLNQRNVRCQYFSRW